MRLLNLMWCGTICLASLLTVPLSATASGCFSEPYSCQSPGDIDPATPRTFDALSEAYARFAWDDFVALNFPAATDAQGNPIPIASSVNGLNYNGGEYTSVWQTYVEARDLFLPDGRAPEPFGSGSAVPAACQSLNAGGVKLLLNRTTKAGPLVATNLLQSNNRKDSDGVLDEYIQAMRMGPVIDRNGRYLRFGLNFNQAVYDYVVQNKLFNAEGQAAFQGGNPVTATGPDWPRGSLNGQVGAVFVKSAWKVLGGADDPANFFRTKAYIYDQAGGIFGETPLAKEQCRIETVGLVGFHIVHRTNTAPQWVWSTFEHVDNAPWLSDFSVNQPMTKNYNLFDPSTCPRTTDGKPGCQYDVAPQHPWQPEVESNGVVKVLDRAPTQVVRVAAPGRHALSVNADMRKKINEAFGITVWDNYFLVDVQFPTIVNWNAASGVASINPAYPDGAPTPSFLANSTLETYIQGFGEGDATTNGNVIPKDDQMQTPPNSTRVDPFNAAGPFNTSGGAQRITSSCVSCHFDAAMTNGVGANFIFSLSRAKPAR